MKDFEQMLDTAFHDAELAAADLPRLDLYMDQILTLFDEGLAANKRHPNDRLLTKTMINNYSKERLIMPIKGKKYSGEQLMQLLCILNLKQNLSLADLKTLLVRDEGGVNFKAAYEASLVMKAVLREKLPALLMETFADADVSDPAQRLALTLALSAGATFFRRACEGVIDNAASEQKTEKGV